MFTEIRYVQKQLSIARMAPNAMIREDAIQRAIDGMEQLEAAADRLTAALYDVDEVTEDEIEEADDPTHG